jgi:hypothetical protein
MKRIVFLSGTGLVSLHILDALLVDVEPGASLARHLPTLAVTLAVAAAAALTYGRLPRGSRAAVAGAFGVLAASDAAQHVKYLSSDFSLTGLLLVPAAALLLFAAAGEAWGLHRGVPRLRAWGRRAASFAGTVALALFVIVPLAGAVYTAHKPRRALGHPDLGAPYRDVSFRSTDNIRLHAWYVPGRNGAAIVVVHGSGGDAGGPRRQVRMLVRHGYGVLDLDARGRGKSEGDNESLGWHWDRDISGAVTWLRAHGVDRVGGLGVSTGAEAMLHAAAEDRRIGAVVADGAQGRRPADLEHWHHGAESAFVLATLGPLMEAYRVLEWSAPPPELGDLVPRIAPRPLLLVSTGRSYERDLNRRYHRLAPGSSLLELQDTGHTQGLQTHPRTYTHAVLTTFHDLCQRCG